MAIMTAFYGGPNGESFRIVHIFTTRYGKGDSIENDLKLGWTSPFPIGSYVMVSYGSPTNETFQDYYDQDMEVESKNYNSTLWKKIYDEGSKTYNGISYQFIASMAGKDGSTPEIEFVKPVEVLGPEESPDFRMAENSTFYKPKIVFRFPRAVRFYFGELLGERQDEVYTLTNPSFEGYAVGDYYINSFNGFIYKVIGVQGLRVTFKYVSCIQSPLPEVKATGISPFKDDGSLNDPTVIRNITDEEKSTWEIIFGLPQTPNPAANATFVGPLEDSGAKAIITDKNTVTFDFKIPAGSKMFAGILVNSDQLTATVEGAKPGDLYLNTATGELYVLQKNGKWEKQQGSIKGPRGKSPNVVKDYTITGEDTFEAGRDLIIQDYPSPDPDKLFSVTFEDSTLGRNTSYWYFYTEEGQWGRVQLTGGVDNLIKNSYTESPQSTPITNKTYSIDYINKLIGQETGPEDKTAYSKQQVNELLSWGTFDEISQDTELELYKFFHGPESKLEQIPLREGRIYFTEDTQKLFIDISGERVEINSRLAEALKKVNEDGTVEELNFDGILLKISSATTVAYRHTITVNSWAASGDEFTSVWEQPDLRCGVSGDVPPIITYTSNQEEYAEIEKAEATRGVGITFTTTSKPTADIGIIIIDHG